MLFTDPRILLNIQASTGICTFLARRVTFTHRGHWCSPFHRCNSCKNSKHHSDLHAPEIKARRLLITARWLQDASRCHFFHDRDFWRMRCKVWHQRVLTEWHSLVPSWAAGGSGMALAYRPPRAVTEPSFRAASGLHMARSSIMAGDTCLCDYTAFLNEVTWCAGGSGRALA